MINEILWMLAIVLFLVIEASTAGLVSIWFAGGALAALIATLFGLEVYMQIGVFLIVSTILLLTLRKIACKHFNLRKESTNSDRLIGEEIVITQTVNNKTQSGKAFVNDVEWKVKSETGDIIEAGESVRISKIEGVKLIVTK